MKFGAWNIPAKKKEEKYQSKKERDRERRTRIVPLTQCRYGSVPSQNN